MIEDLKVIYEGKATIIKNKQYLDAKAYIEPFVTRMQEYTKNFICNVKVADQISVTGFDTDTVYNKVSVIAVFPEEWDFVCSDTIYHRVVVMSYGLDVKKPVCKFYTGVVDPQMNFYAFGADCISIQEIEPETALDYSYITNIINNGLKDNCKQMIEQFDSLVYPKSKMTETLGDWIDFCIKKEYINDAGKVKLATTMAIDSYKNLTVDKDSDFYSLDSDISFNSVYRSFAHQIARDDKDILNRYEKTQLINQMLKL